jgi:sodium-dependent dicarboxylate transporter 2/3/5
MNISEQEKMLFKELLGELGLLISRAINSLANNKFNSGELFNIFLALALSLNVHPYFLMVGVTLAASSAFMLPVATPPNAVVFSSNLLTIPDMIKVGLVMNIISILLATLLVYYLLSEVWGINFDILPKSIK